MVQQNYPNPCSDNTSVEFRLKETSEVVLIITDLTGQTVKSFPAKQFERGRNKFDLNTSELGNRLYYNTLKSGVYSSTKTMLVIK